MTRIPNVHADAVYAEAHATRQRLADIQNAQLREAIDACGPGADGYGRWVLVDKLKLLPDRGVYCCRRDDGRGWQPTPNFPDQDERLGPHNHPGFVNNKTGEITYPFRFSSGMNTLQSYTPQTAERMKAAAEGRRDAALKKERAAIDAQVAAAAEAAYRQPSLFPTAPAAVVEGTSERERG